MTKFEKVQIARSIIENARRENKFATVDFVKKNGELRRMTIGRSRALENAVKGTNPEATEARRRTLAASNMMTVEELSPEHESRWRTLNLESVTRIKAGGIERVFDV